MADDTSFSSRAIREFHNALTAGSIFGVPRYTTALLPSVTSNQGGLAWDTTTNSLKGCNGTTWVGINGAASFPLLAPDGTSTAPSYSFSSDSDSGLRYESTFGPGLWLQADGTSTGPYVKLATGTPEARLYGGNGNSGGIVVITGGASAGSNIAGPAVTIIGGAATAGAAVGGNVTLTGGAGFGGSLNGNVSITTGTVVLERTITAAGTTGDRTIDKMAGTVNIATAGTTVTVTNKYCTTSSLVFAVLRTNDTTARLANVVPGSGSFVINIVACAAEVSIGFWLVN